MPRKPKPKKPANRAYPQRVRARAKADAADEGARRIKEARARHKANLASGKTKAVRITPAHLARMTDRELAANGLGRMGGYVIPLRRFEAPKLFRGVVPAGAHNIRPIDGETARIALDSSLVAPTYAWANQFCSQIGFPGYPYLAQLSLRSEFRAPAETTAKEMTRRWLKLKSASAGDKGAKISEMEQALRDFKVRSVVRKGVEYDNYFGRYQIYVGIKGQDSERARTLPLKLDGAGLGEGCLENIQGIEPMWTTPYSYNSIDPTRPDFYKPVSWFTLGRKTHASRLLDIISRPVPDLFKPAYNFGGLSMSQLMEPYVMQWYRTRDAVSDVVYSYSTSGIATNLSAYLEDDDGGEDRRAQHFNQTKGNRGLLLIDKDTEEFFQYNVPLGSLDKLQAQSQEHMAAPSHTPLVKLLGVTPTGLNASSEGEIKVYYDWIHSEQESVLDDPVEIILTLIQYHLFGSYDPDIIFEWVHMDEPTQKELSEIRTADQVAGTGYIAAGVISNVEERDRLMRDPQSGYSNLTGPPPALTPEQELQASQQEHEGSQSEQDQKANAQENDKDRAHAGKQSDADRKLTEKTTVVKAKAATKKKAPGGTKAK